MTEKELLQWIRPYGEVANHVILVGTLNERGDTKQFRYED